MKVLVSFYFCCGEDLFFVLLRDTDHYLEYDGYCQH